MSATVNTFNLPTIQNSSLLAVMNESRYQFEVRSLLMQSGGEGAAEKAASGCLDPNSVLSTPNCLGESACKPSAQFFRSRCTFLLIPFKANAYQFNQITAANAGIARRFHVGHRWAGVAEFCR